MLIATLTALAFLGLGLVHVFWAAGGKLGFEAVVPTLPVAATAAGAGDAASARPAFTPSRAATFGVAVGLIGIAVLVALRAGLVGTALQNGVLTAAIGLLAVLMFVRAVGDFRLVGFFKKVVGTPFARWDSLVYSPLCVLLGLGLASVACP